MPTFSFLHSFLAYSWWRSRYMYMYIRLEVARTRTGRQRGSEKAKLWLAFFGIAKGTLAILEGIEN